MTGCARLAPKFYTDAQQAQSLASSPLPPPARVGGQRDRGTPCLSHAGNPYVTGEDCATSELDDDTLAARDARRTGSELECPLAAALPASPACYSAIELRRAQGRRDLDPERRDTRGQRAEDPIKAYPRSEEDARASRPDAKGPGEPRAAGSRGVGSARSNR
ncbi:hypothetical protein Q5P01_000530 [Channa striata]|uniref:Uncharacterized protein n=1 Tax=Channa striata TaxID=64152 RepID=A0AA88LME5_CHASR|nr:hypothetical protein Q5P01_000530 [Channa striata]